MAEFELGSLLVSSTRRFTDFVGNTDTEDTYRFSLTSPTNFNALLTGLSQDADLRLYRDVNGNGTIDGFDTFIGSSTLGVSSDEYLNLRLTTSGDYIAQVYRFGSSNTNYTLILSNTGSSPSNLLPREIGAGTLTSTPFVRTDSLGTNDAADVYSFTMSSAGNFNASITGISTGADVDVRLIRDANNNGVVDTGDELVRSTNGSNADEAINVRSLASGNYLLQTYLFNSPASANYTVRMSNTGSSPSNLLPVETNVGTVTSSTSRTGSVNVNDASDTFQFRLSSNRTVNLSLTGLSADADLRLIRDSNNNGAVDAGEELQRSAFAGTTSESISRSLTSGQYFAQVYLFPSTGSTNYTLGIA